MHNTDTSAILYTQKIPEMGFVLFRFCAKSLLFDLEVWYPDAWWWISEVLRCLFAASLSHDEISVCARLWNWGIAKTCHLYTKSDLYNTWWLTSGFRGAIPDFQTKPMTWFNSFHATFAEETFACTVTLPCVIFFTRYKRKPNNKPH